MKSLEKIFQKNQSNKKRLVFVSIHILGIKNYWINLEMTVNLIIFLHNKIIKCTFIRLTNHLINS